MVDASGDLARCRLLLASQCPCVPDTASTAATHSAFSASVMSLSSSGSTSSVPPSPLPGDVAADGCQAWLLHPQHGCKSAPPEVRQLVDALEQRLRAEMRRAQARSDERAQELERRVSCICDDMQAQGRRLDRLEKASDRSGKIPDAKQPADGNISQRLDELGARIKQTGLALVNFNERIGSLECKLMQTSTTRATAGAPSVSVLGERVAGVSGLAESVLKDIRVELDQERAERVAGTEQIRQVAHENRSAITETRLLADKCSEGLTTLTKRVRIQERSQNDVRELQEAFFTNARTALASVENGARYHASSPMTADDLDCTRMMQQAGGQP